MLFVFSPVLLITALLVRVKLGSPVLFVQIRPGKNGEPFKMLKFRSMTDEKDEFGKLLPNEKRFTSFGSFLRSTSMDELPGLFNVLRGDMSLIGPRPLLMDYLPLYNDFQSRRNEVKPGITGWAQVNGRNAISWDEKFKYDVWYVDNHNFWIDSKILFLTVAKVLKRSDINHGESVPMPRFKGNAENKS